MAEGGIAMQTFDFEILLQWAIASQSSKTPPTSEHLSEHILLNIMPGALTEAEREQVTAHLFQCKECREKLFMIAATEAMLAPVTEPVSATEGPQVAQAIVRPSVPRRHLKFSRVLIAVAACLLAAVGITIFTLYWTWYQRSEVEALLAQIQFDGDWTNLPVRKDGWTGLMGERDEDTLDDAVDRFLKIIDRKTAAGAVADEEGVKATLGLAYLMAEHYSNCDKAIKYLEAISTRVTNSADIYAALGWSYFGLGTTQRVIKYPEDRRPEAIMLFQKAVKCFQKAISLTEKAGKPTAVLHFNLARTYEALAELLQGEKAKYLKQAQLHYEQARQLAAQGSELRAQAEEALEGLSRSDGGEAP